MRQPDPLILGAGPAGCAAAITLARGGAQPLLIDRSEQVGDPLCGGFLSWQTVRQLQSLGVDCAELGAHPVHRLRLFTDSLAQEMALPATAYGLSRHALDIALRSVAQAAGVKMEFDHITGIEPGAFTGTAIGKKSQWQADSIFLATGKEDVRGETRPRLAADPAMGLRVRLPPSPDRNRLMSGAIELHLFKGGYAGIVLQEGGHANICLALRKSALTRAGNRPAALLAKIAEESQPFAERLGDDWRDAAIDTIGAVPYGWIAQDTTAGLFRIGDQAAVIPSLAGEGIGIALASGTIAANAWLSHGAQGASDYQQSFARAAWRPVKMAALARTLAESPLGAQIAARAVQLAPSFITAIASLSRIATPPALAHQRSAA